MSTEPAPAPQPPPAQPRRAIDIDSLLVVPGTNPDPKDEQIATLEEQVQELNNKHYEERFIWVLVALVLFDAMIFLNMSNWTAPIVIGIIELVAIVIMADRCRVDTVAPLIDRITGALGQATAKGKKFSDMDGKDG